METTILKCLKPKSLITGIDFSSSFYGRLTSLFLEIASMKGMDYHKETLAILMATLDEAAEAQGLTEESEVKDLGI